MRRLMALLFIFTGIVSISSAGKSDTTISRDKAIAAAKSFMKSQNYKAARYDFKTSRTLLTVDSLLTIGSYKSFNYRRAKAVKRSLTYPFFWRIRAEGKDPMNDGIFEILIDAKKGKMVYYDPVS